MSEQVTPKQKKPPQQPTPTLEAPKPVAPLMQATPKQRADLARVSDMLREGQPRGDGDDEEEEENEEGSPDSSPPAQPEIPSTPAVLPAAASENAPQRFGHPDWFKMPSNGLPGDVEPGSTVIFVRFPVWMTGSPTRGERQCAVRPLTPKLERWARAKVPTGDKTSGYDLAEEYAKAMLCVVDGSRAELFKAGPGSVNHFWSEIGPKCREMLLVQFNRLHRLSTAERKSFLDDCVSVRTVG